MFLNAFCFGQEEKSATWEKEKEYLKYHRAKKYDGPTEWHGSNAPDIKDEEITYSGGGYSAGSYGSGGSGNRKRGIQYSPQQIKKDRQKRYQGLERGGGKGDVQFDPEIERPDPIEIPDIDAPDIDLPDINLPDINAPSIPFTIWKILGFTLLFALVMIIAYLIIRNRKPANRKVIMDVENNWNPEVISKTELDLKLEAAMEGGDYRECVRIYFTFILKELIRKNWIVWKKEKTNHHYVMEMGKQTNARSFMECVRIYDLVWYGDYNIDQEIFELLRPTLENYYQSLEPVNE